jgi:hypothetical protein
VTSRTSLYVSIASVIALGGCHLISGVDDLDFDVPPSEGGASGAGGPGAGGNGGEGGGGGCAACGECAPCIDGACAPLPLGDACTGGLCDGAGVCAVGDIQWSRRFDSDATNEVRGVAFDLDGALTVGGTFNGSSLKFPAKQGATPVELFGSSSARAFLALLDPATGDGLAAFALGGSGLSFASVLRAGRNAGTMYLGGTYFNGALKVGNLPATSSIIGGYVAAFHADEPGPSIREDWVLALSAADVKVLDVAASPLANELAIVGVAGNVVYPNDDTLTLHTNPTVTVMLQTTRTTGFVAVVTQDGSTLPDHLWSDVMRHFDTTNNLAQSALRGVAYTADGALWTVGDYRGLWYPAKVSNSPFDNQSVRAGFIAKYSGGTTPTPSCHGHFATESTEDDHEIHAVAATPDGGAVVVGTFAHSIRLAPGEPMLQNQAGDPDLIIAKFETCTKVAWHQHIADAYAFNHRVAVDADGNVILAGSFSSQIQLDGRSFMSGPGADAFVAKLAGSNGSFLWYEVSQVTGTEAAFSLATSPTTRSVVIGGSTESQLFGSTDPTQPGTSAFVTSFGP